jgi:hypothetical protein
MNHSAVTAGPGFKSRQFRFGHREKLILRHFIMSDLIAAKRGFPRENIPLWLCQAVLPELFSTFSILRRIELFKGTSIFKERSAVPFSENVAHMIGIAQINYIFALSRNKTLSLAI